MRYLLVSYLRKVNGQIDEMVAVAKRLKTSDTNTCNVIIDFADKKVLKSVIEGKNHETTFEKLRDYYAKIYPNLVDQLEKEAGITKAQDKLAAKVSFNPKKK